MKDIVILEYFKNAILNGHKCAIMLQDHIDDNTLVTFCSIEHNKEVPFATAIFRSRMFMRLNSKNETIVIAKPSLGGAKWEVCDEHRTKKIINNEGFLHTDDFWHNILEKGIFEVNQYYFDTLKIITQPLQIVD